MTHPPAPALPLLDELDELRAKATPGRWQSDNIFGDIEALDEHGFAEVIGNVDNQDDAALIVAAVNRLPELTTALRAVLVKHVPWYEVDGVRHDNLVRIGCADFDGCDADGIVADCAESDGDGHEVLACSECRTVIDGDLPGHLLWPCPTVAAITTALEAS